MEIRGLAGAEGGGVFWGAAGGSPPCPGVWALLECEEEIIINK